MMGSRYRREDDEQSNRQKRGSRHIQALPRKYRSSFASNADRNLNRTTNSTNMSEDLLGTRERAQISQRMNTSSEGLCSEGLRPANSEPGWTRAKIREKLEVITKINHLFRSDNRCSLASNGFAATHRSAGLAIRKRTSKPKQKSIHRITNPCLENIS
jgi:hypothetical protein